MAPSVAAPPAGSPAPPAPHEAVEPISRDDSYRGLLTASYVLAPLAALAVGGALSELEVSDDVAVLAGSTLFVAPAVVHVAHGKHAYGPLSLLGLAGATGTGLLLGGVAGYFIDHGGCDSAEDSEGCDVFTTIDGIIYGSLIGSIAAYTGFAILDVSMNGDIPPDEPRADRASLQLWLSPLPASRSERAESSIPFGGMQLGATLQL